MNNILKTAWLMALLLVFTSCDEDDDPAPAQVNFENTTLGISEAISQVTVRIVFSRALSSDTEFQLRIEPGGLVYGAMEDFYTTPEASQGVIGVQAVAGTESIEVTVHQGSGLNIQEDQTISVTLENAPQNLQIGVNNSVSVTFSENFIATSGTIELNGGGEDFPNQAFIDLSKLQQTTADKYSWDLGFYSGENHRVILNGSAFHMARPIDQTDLSAVSAADTAGFAGDMVIPQFDPSVGAVAWVDHPNGDLSATAFGEIAASAINAQVYIIKRDNGPWKKVKVYQDGAEYVLESADINSSDITTARIAKNQAFNFTYFSFESGEVKVAPEKNSWDIMYSTFTEHLNLGAPGLDIPYGFKDFIVLNRNNTSVAMVMNADFAFAAFSMENTANLTFESATDGLGENWRQGGGPGSAPSLYEDRFFVIKDSEENYYKVRFNRLTSTGGERGYPEFTFELLQ